MLQYAKALAGALTALAVYLIAQVGLDLPDEIVAALTTLLTGLVVWLVRNKQPYPSRDDVRAAVVEGSNTNVVR